MKRPKIGLALGSGGARGFAHLGVLKVLQNEGIPVDMIAGSSMGALVGCLYGAGQDIELLNRFAIAFKRKYILDFTVPKYGLIEGKRVKDLISLFTHGKTFEQLKIPVAVVATDLQTGEKVVFKEGSITNSVRASISIPGIFVPEVIDGRIFVDGGVVDRVPVSVVKEMGADIVIAVDVTHINKQLEVESIADVIIQSLDILQSQIVDNTNIEADVIIKPRVEIFSPQSFTNTAEIIKIGEEETAKEIKKIHSLIEQWRS